jgi:putative DNA primase/helicase
MRRPDGNDTLVKEGEHALLARADAAELVVPYEDEQLTPLSAQSLATATSELVEKIAITQDAVADAFAEQAQGKLRFDLDQNIWLAWNAARWTAGGKHVGFQFARRLARQAAAGGKPSELREAGKAAFAAGVEKFAQGDERLAVQSDAWNRDPFLLGTPAGTVDLRTGDLRKARPEDGITKLAAVAPLDQAECPRFKEFLDFATGRDKKLARYLQQVAGYCLTGDVREQALWFFYGNGGNGKGTFVNTIADVMGDYATVAAMDTFTASKNDRHTTDLAMLRGARLVRASETENGRAWAEARIKQLTGGDPITARFMRQDNFTFLPQFKLIFLGNHKPVLHNVDEAARRRFNIIPFDQKPPRRDPDLSEKLRAEAPAILRWMIDGCLDWQRNGLQKPERVSTATDSYFADQDLFQQWLDEECNAEPGNQYRKEARGKLFESWKAYAARAGIQAGEGRGFADTMQSRGFLPCKGTGGIRMYSGVELRIPERNWHDQ